MKRVIRTVHMRGSHKLFIDGVEVEDQPTEVDLVRAAEKNHGFLFRNARFEQGGGTDECFSTNWYENEGD